MIKRFGNTPTSIKIKLVCNEAESKPGSQLEIGSVSEEPVFKAYDMTPEQKIAKVLRQIKDEAAINPDPRLMKFGFNYHVVGSGILSEDEERRILFKLEKEGVIKLRLSQYEDNEPREIAVISSVEGERYMTSPYYWVEILEGFENAYNNFSSHLESISVKKKESDKQKHDNNDHSSTKDSITILGDYFHGDKIGHDKNINSNHDTPLWLKWVGIIATILALVWAIYIYFNPNELISNPITKLTPGANDFSTTTPNLADIFLKINSMLDLEKENFLRDFKNGPVYTVGAEFDNINSSGDGFIVRMTVERNAVGCAFSSDFKKELLLLREGDKINFYGIFTGSGLGGYGAVNPWYITDCILLK